MSRGLQGILQNVFTLGWLQGRDYGAACDNGLLTEEYWDSLQVQERACIENASKKIRELVKANPFDFVNYGSVDGEET